MHAVARDAKIPAPIVGHVGDGNFHMMLMTNPGKADDMLKAERIVEKMVQRAQSMSGTCTGEGELNVDAAILWPQIKQIERPFVAADGIDSVATGTHRRACLLFACLK